MSNNARLFVISAPSGCGKGTILAEVFAKSRAVYSVSCTTRSPRDGEENGVNYYFLDNEQFEKMIADRQLLEYAGFVEHYYGTPLQPVLENLEAGRDVILEIETKGAFQVKQAMPEAVLIFVLPPSVKELDRRLRKRGTEKEEDIRDRVAIAAEEISKAYDYDYVIMNDALEDAVGDFRYVVESIKAGNSEADRFKANSKETKNMIDEVLNNA